MWQKIDLVLNNKKIVNCTIFMMSQLPSTQLWIEINYGEAADNVRKLKSVKSRPNTA